MQDAISNFLPILNKSFAWAVGKNDCWAWPGQTYMFSEIVKHYIKLTKEANKDEKIR